VYAVSVADQYLYGSVVPFLQNDLGLTAPELGVLGGAVLITSTLAAVPIGTLVDRVRRTRVISWGAVLWGFSMLWFGLAPGFLLLLAARAALGITQPAGGPASLSLLSDYYPVHQRSKVMGVYQSGQLLAFLLIPIGAAMATAWGWRSAFYFLAIPGFVVAMLAWRLPEPTRGDQDRRHHVRSRAAAELAAARGTESKVQRLDARAAYVRILSCRTYTVALVSTGIGGFFFGGIATWTVLYMTIYHRLTVPQASVAVSLFALGGLVGALTSGPLTDRLIHAGHPAARMGVPAASRIACSVLLAASFAVSNTAVMLLTFTAASALIIAPLPPLNAALADVLHPELRGRGIALYGAVKALCEGASSIIIGFLYTMISLKASFLVLVPCVAISGLILLLFGVRSYTKDRQRMLDELLDTGDRKADHSAPPAAAPPASSAPAAVPVAPAASPVALTPAPSGNGSTPTPPEPLLEIDHIDLSYGAVQVLFGLDAVVAPSGCHVLIGRNGVGKTTVLTAIAGLIEPQSGQIRFKGNDITGVPAEQRARIGITLVMGGHATFGGLSVKDNLWMGAYPFTRARQLVGERLAAVLEIFPALAPRLGQAAGTLSGGEQQMMALGRALMAGPELMLVDEFSMGLAPIVVLELARAARRIVELGTTLIVVEQSVEVALGLADEVLYMDRGGIRHLGPPVESMPATLADLMLGAEEWSE
jgi:ABC-type branched-subunit amino acid transport system ATPase component/sugar phosphate permease